MTKFENEKLKTLEAISQSLFHVEKTVFPIFGGGKEEFDQTHTTLREGGESLMEAFEQILE